MSKRWQARSHRRCAPGTAISRRWTAHCRFIVPSPAPVIVSGIKYAGSGRRPQTQGSTPGCQAQAAGATHAELVIYDCIIEIIVYAVWLSDRDAVAERDAEGAAGRARRHRHLRDHPALVPHVRPDQRERVAPASPVQMGNGHGCAGPGPGHVTTNAVRQPRVGVRWRRANSAIMLSNVRKCGDFEC